MNPEITLTEAVEWTTEWRSSSAYTAMGIKAFAFSASDILNLIETQNPDKVRFYLGKNNDGYQLFCVGVDGDGKDMTDLIYDLNAPCPTTCDQTSPLV